MRFVAAPKIVEEDTRISGPEERVETGAPFKELRELVDGHLDPDVFEPEVSRGWYVTVVK